MNPLQMDVSGTFLEDLDEQNQKVEFRELMTNSVWYVLLNRCGLDVQEYLDAEDFRHITDFNQLKVMGHLGSSVNEISRPVLMQIGRYVLDDLEKDLKTVAVAKEKKVAYNKFNTLIRESETKNTEDREKNKEETEHERDHLQPERRVSDSRYQPGRDKRNNREVRNDEERVSEKLQGSQVQHSDTAEPSGQSSDGDRQSGKTESRQPDERTSRERSGTRQDGRHNGMDQTHEPDQSTGRGTGDPGDYLQLSLFPTEEEQFGEIRKAAAALEQPAAFLISDEVVDHILRTGSGQKNTLFAKATALAIKAIIAGTKALIAAIAAGGWVAVLVIIVICLIGMILGSVFGIFFSDEDSGTGMSMQTVVQEINTEYDTKLQEEKNSVSYDVLEMSGSRAVWKEVLAVYSVKTNTDQDNPQEVATMDDGKKQLLKDIFWEMNQISSRTESKTETVITETDDGHGNIVETESTVTQTYLYITVSHKTAEEMAAQYGFNEEQKGYLAELLADENNYLWSQVLYGITGGDGQIVTVALSLVGNVGGQPYWSWYGFNSRVEWCACFVSWCANECGYIDAGVIPKYAGCVNGVQWFKDRGQWLDGSAEPAPGMIIFFDWADESGQDGLSDHTGIVQKVENGKVYTVEGNSGDSCRVNEYSIGYYEILGYGAPAY